MFERFTGEARAVVVGAQIEAAALAHGWIGTEHLVLGLVREADSPTARLLARWDVDAGWVRGEVERIIGRGEPDLDAGALATLGIDLDEIRARVEGTFGPGALARARCRRGGLGLARAVHPEGQEGARAVACARRWRSATTISARSTCCSACSASAAARARGSCGRAGWSGQLWWRRWGRRGEGGSARWCAPRVRSIVDRHRGNGRPTEEEWPATRISGSAGRRVPSQRRGVVAGHRP